MLNSENVYFSYDHIFPSKALDTNQSGFGRFQYDIDFSYLLERGTA